MFCQTRWHYPFIPAMMPSFLQGKHRAHMSPGPGAAFSSRIEIAFLCSSSRERWTLHLLLYSQLDDLLVPSLSLFLLRQSSTKSHTRAIRTMHARPIRMRFWAVWSQKAKSGVRRQGHCWQRLHPPHPPFSSLTFLLCPEPFLRI